MFFISFLLLTHKNVTETFLKAGVFINTTNFANRYLKVNISSKLKIVTKVTKYLN